MNFFFKVKKSIVGLKIPKPFERQAEGTTCQHGGVVLHIDSKDNIFY